MNPQADSLTGRDSGAAGPIVAARELFKRFRIGTTEIEVLRGVSFEIFPGESVAIRGESGSGKTTLLHVLAGLERADSGRLEWAGAEVGGLDPSSFARRRSGFLGMVFQAIHLIPELDVLDNLLMAPRLLGRVGPVERERARELLRRVGLAGREHQLTTRLSGGERQRVAVARALMNRPRLLIADEPTGNLDERTGAAVMDLLLELCRETATGLILVTHNPEHAARCGRVELLHLGRLVGGVPGA